MKIRKISLKEGGRAFVVGDIHGMYSLLMYWLEKVGFNKEKDMLICTGDLIDRGSENLECLRLLDEEWFETAMGNHDSFSAIGITIDGQLPNEFRNKMNIMANFATWMCNGGAWILGLNQTQYEEAKRRLINLSELPHAIEINSDGKKYVVCHATYPLAHYDENIILNEKQKEKVIWDRSDQYSDHHINGADFFVFGHNPDTKGVRRMGNRFYIDTGSYKEDGDLTVIELSKIENSVRR